MSNNMLCNAANKVYALGCDGRLSPPFYGYGAPEWFVDEFSEPFCSLRPQLHQAHLAVDAVGDRRVDGGLGDVALQLRRTGGATSTLRT